MAKRYRSLRKGQRMLGGKIIFVDHLFPQQGDPPCDDERLCNFIETRPGFGSLFWVDRGEGEDVIVDPEAIPDGVTESDMEGAARALQNLGYNVNPALLKKQEAEEEPPPEPQDEEPNLPTLTSIRKSSKPDLISMAKRLGWDEIDINANAVHLRESMLEKARSLMN